MPRIHVANAYGIDRSTLYRWLESYHQEGVEGLYRSEGSGRPKLLGELSEKELRTNVLTSALSYGFESDLWTVGRLHQVITARFHVLVSKHTIWRRLVDAGLTYQKPEREYYEADESVRQKWRRYEIPKIRRCVLENKAILCF
jgi:transposase